MPKTLDKARQQFEAGKYKPAVRTLWELECEVRGGDDTEGAQGLVSRAPLIVSLVMGGIFFVVFFVQSYSSPSGYAPINPLLEAVDSLLKACVVAAFIRFLMFVFSKLDAGHAKRLNAGSPMSSARQCAVPPGEGAAEITALGQAVVVGAAAPMSLPVATFNQTTGWPGRTITFEETRRQFILQDHGPITAQDVLSYDAQGQVDWTREGLHQWLCDIADWERTPRPETETTGQPSSEPSPASLG
jgi:hypothetical protein